jgi:CRP-like cAMP-binding protein
MRSRTASTGAASSLSAEAPAQQAFDVAGCLASAAPGCPVAQYRKGAVAFEQGDPALDVRFIQKGSIRLSVLSHAGKEAIIATLGAGDFFGEGTLAGQMTRIETATAVSTSSVLIVGRDAMARLLREEPAFSNRFIAHMLARNLRIEADLIDQLFNGSEKRLARALLLLARYGNDHQPPRRTLPKISQEALAEMVGTTRSRVNFFMNKFRKLGLIEYSDGQPITVNSGLVNIVLH